MPCYPALCLLLGSAMDEEGVWIRRGTRVLTVLATVAAVIVAAILYMVRNTPTPGDISMALTQRLKAYTLALSHMQDLNLQAFAYLRFPLALAGVSFLIVAVGAFRGPAQRAFLAATVMMVVFFQAARLAMVTFDPYMSSRPLAQALLRSPEGTLIVDHHYYTFSSVFFYTDREALLLNGRFNNFEYGSNAPGAPAVFMKDAELQSFWSRPERYYLVTKKSDESRLKGLVGSEQFIQVAESGGKFVVTNHPLGNAPNGF